MHIREFGDYRIVKLLPLGGMGRVYLAVHQTTNQPVALKLIDLGMTPEQQQIVAAEKRGAILQARLCGIDPRIVRIDAYGEYEDFFYIEMEYVEGEDLSEVLVRGPLGVPFAARIGADVCEVLNVTHTFSGEIDGHQYRGIVHGDIKPRNIRITPDGQVKVLDFGIAKALSLTRMFTQNQFASSQYSSPERLNTGEVDVASDLWSVAVVLYEIVAGRPYFEGENGAKVEREVRNYRQVRSLAGTVPLPFRQILERALSPEPARRYGSAASLAADLRAFLAGRPTAAQEEPEYDDVTRRTARPSAAATTAFDDAPTRRTTPTASPAAARPSVQKPQAGRGQRLRLYAGLVAAMVLFWLFYREYSVWTRARELRREIETEQLTDLNAAWTRYDAIAKSSALPVLLSGTRNRIQERLTSVADRVIEEYRNNDAPSVTEGDWIRSRNSLSHALELSPGDKEIRSRMYVCEGHINRIRADARKLPKLYPEARSRFEEARELQPKSPDPYLGLARLYAYAFHDVDRAEEAIKQADKHGHKVGRREKAQLGDAYRDRAEKLVAEADRSVGLPEEQDFLKRAEGDFQRAKENYQDIVPFAGSASSLRRVLDYLANIEERLKGLKEPHVNGGNAK